MLKGDRAGQYSNRSTQQWRICFRCDLTKPWAHAVGFVVATGLVVPVFGVGRVVVMLASQAVSPVVMPLVIAIVLYMLNTKHAAT